METHISYEYSNMNDHESVVILEEFLKEVDDKGHKLFKKMVEKDVPIREILHEFHGKHGSTLEKIARKLNKIEDRGVDGDVLQEDKLERFRLKTVNAIGAGLIKEE